MEMPNEGMVSDFRIERVGVNNADCDMYRSTKAVFLFMVLDVQNCTVLLFNDLLCYRANHEKEEQVAVRE